MKKIIFIVSTLLIVFLIYIGLQDKKVYYVAIGDSLIKGITNEKKIYDYNNNIAIKLNKQNKLEKYINISKDNYKIPDIIRDINNNIEISNKTLKNILIKADVLTISVGSIDLINKLNTSNNYEFSNYINSYLRDLDELLILLRQYCKEDIIFIGYYSINNDNDKYINYINNRIKQICLNNNIYFLDISDISSYDLYLTNKDYDNISYNIEKYIFKNVIN